MIPFLKEKKPCQVKPVLHVPSLWYKFDINIIRQRTCMSTFISVLTLLLFNTGTAVGFSDLFHPVTDLKELIINTFSTLNTLSE